jgi:hypothetical protein
MFLEAASTARDSTITDWLTGIGTISAVVAALSIAIWGDWMKALFARPRLVITIGMRPPDCHKIQVQTQAHQGQVLTVALDVYSEAYWFRLSVGNVGRVTARNVEVRLLSLQVLGPEGVFEDDPSFIPLGLIWSHSMARSMVAARIPRGVPKHCDLCHVLDPAGDAPRLFEFDTEVSPRQVGPDLWPTRKPPGTYRGRLVVTADNAGPTYFDFEIKYTGWFDDETTMFQRGFTVTVS